MAGLILLWKGTGSPVTNVNVTGFQLTVHLGTVTVEVEQEVFVNGWQITVSLGNVTTESTRNAVMASKYDRIVKNTGGGYSFISRMKGKL